jgi:hypothetical protein|tara:strand:+ start:1400 stop:1690 length:291 start_codon:yes stop_codon:yes gene_type:complete
MVVLSTSILLLNNSTVLDNIKNINNKAKMLSNNVFIMIYMTMLLMVTALPAVMVAINCNPDNKVLFGLLSFFFSDIYLLQWAVKKFILKKENYCKI